MFYFALQSSRVPKSCKIKFFFYTNNTGSITQVNEEFYSYFFFFSLDFSFDQSARPWRKHLGQLSTLCATIIIMAEDERAQQSAFATIFFYNYIYFFRPRVSLHDISNKASLILEDNLDLFTPGVGQP